jgi:hypothetical protein
VFKWFSFLFLMHRTIFWSPWTDSKLTNHSKITPTLNLGDKNGWVTGGTNQFIGKNQDWIWWGDFLVRGGFNPLFNILKSHFFSQVWFSFLPNLSPFSFLQWDVSPLAFSSSTANQIAWREESQLTKGWGEN